MGYPEIAKKMTTIYGWEGMPVKKLADILCLSPATIGAVIRYHKRHNGIIQEPKPHKKTHNKLIREMMLIRGWETINPADIAKMLGCKTITARVIIWKKTNNPWLGLGTGRKTGEPHHSKREKVEQIPSPFNFVKRFKSITVPIVPAFGNVLSWKTKEIEKPVKIKPKKEYEPCGCGKCPLGKQSDECHQIEMAGRPRLDPSLEYLNSKSFC